MKKAQGLSMNMIVIAAIAMIVLLVVVFILTGRLKTAGDTSRSCEQLQGECLVAADCPLSNYIRRPGTNCGNQNAKDLPITNSSYVHCCVEIFSTDAP